MSIERLSPLTHQSLPGVHIYPVSGEIARGAQQQVLVVAKAGSRIPLHRHSVDARMIVVSGAAILRSKIPELDGHHVETGDIVFFERDTDHGFDVGDAGLRFLSENGGIVDEAGAWDLVMA